MYGAIPREAHMSWAEGFDCSYAVGFYVFEMQSCVFLPKYCENPEGSGQRWRQQKWIELFLFLKQKY